MVLPFFCLRNCFPAFILDFSCHHPLDFIPLDFLASRQTPVTIEMLLPITRIEVGVRNRVATVQHHGIAHINADMGNAGGVVGADEKYKVAGLGLLRGNRGRYCKGPVRPAVPRPIRCD